MSEEIEPLNRNVVIKLEPQEQQRDSGLFVPTNTKFPVNATVLRVASDVQGNINPNDGVKLFFGKAVPLSADNPEVAVVNEEDLLIAFR